MNKEMREMDGAFGQSGHSGGQGSGGSWGSDETTWCFLLFVFVFVLGETDGRNKSGHRLRVGSVHSCKYISTGIIKDNVHVLGL